MDEEIASESTGVLESRSYYVVLERPTDRPIAFCEQGGHAARLSATTAGTYVRQADVTIRYTLRAPSAPSV